jgi:hypothetical protein
LVVAACLLAVRSPAQYLGGRYGFSFLRLPSHAPLAALGGVNVSQRDRNVNFFLSNPALLSEETDKTVSVNYSPYYAGIAHSSVAYADRHGKAGHWGAAIQYLDYGTMEETDPTGAVLGTFSAREYAAVLGYAHTMAPYTLGVNLKLAGSHLAEYSAFAALLDIGGVFKHPVHDWTLGLLIRNAGLALKHYTPGAQTPLPFDVQLGTSFKPKFMPLRFTLTAHHLHRFDIAHDDPALRTTVDQNGQEVARKATFADKLARHFSFGTELSLGKPLKIMAGYNHLVRREMRLEERPTGAGFSLGAALQVKAFGLAYARFFQHSGGGVSYLTLTGNLKNFGSKQP